MQLDTLHFTPLASLSGGALIGLAAGGFALLLGRIMGVSGIVGGLLSRGGQGDRAWRLSFIVGLLAAPLVWQLGWRLPDIQVAAGPVTLVVAGLLVGFGTRLGSGCTSGHGVCGLARGTLRSLIATMTFMLVAVVTVYIMRHVLGA
ncbi:YeeE/YedE family protein [Chitinimonas viridis]|uniref:YeeE/YedE family protein n=1 Tax=Chitinimonas viridis TaxID=664880 RepID=A0ABT8B6D1_9NEIS|nr:YeeE/YedE family protein [Chitinimonas viridis]MDN3577405.1 YeeE/YedE family protein [Chitinimonas viridis]